MPDDDQNASPQEEPSRNQGPLSLAEELGVVDLSEPIFGARGRLFSAAGPQSPIAEFTREFVILHPPQKPFEEDSVSEDIVLNVDSDGVILDEFGAKKSIPGARYKGHQLFWLGKQMPGTTKHFAGWFDAHRHAHLLYINGHPVTTDIVFELRNRRTHDGEISVIANLVSDDEERDAGSPSEPSTE